MHSPFLPFFDNMALHSFNSSEEQFQASRIMFQDQYSANEFSVAHTLASGHPTQPMNCQRQIPWPIVFA